jgi:predicted amidohydrolase YtcJ
MTSYWFRNGEVYTVDSAQPWASGIVVHDEWIAYVGDDQGAQAHRRADTIEVDLEGRFVMPGFIDGHDHLIGGALTKVGVSLHGLEGKEAVVEAIKQYALEHPERPVIRGHGWTPFTFGFGVQPRRTWLDPVTDVRPALMHTYDCHDGWANTAAFIAAGIDATTPDPNPPSGTWPREADGFPMGTCCEPESWLPIAIALGMFSLDAVEEAMRLTLFPAPTWGITTYFDASPIVNTHKLAMEVYERLIEIDTKGGGLPVRIVGSHALRNAEVPAEVSVARLRELNAEVRSPNLSITTLKMFMDGVGPQHTAALLEPYTDQPENYGPFVFEPDLVARHVAAANLAGFDAHMHACGDAGVRGALDAVEQVQVTHGPLGARNTICHLELCNIDDVPRFAELGITANGTPVWGTDYRGEFMDAYPQLIGNERFTRDYVPYGSLVRSGALLTFGGDCPGVEVDEIAPLKQIEAAVTRQRAGRPGDRICGPHERMTLADALRCYTINGAIALRLETEVGSIEAGKRADLVILQHNPFSVAAHEIHAIGVAHTMLGGRFTHGGAF